MIMNRRSFLTAGAGAAALVLTPEALLAATANRVAGDWSLAFADLEADLPRHAMRLIHGQAPAGLSGALYRNGSGKFRRPGGSATHWFDGDGLMRAFRIHDGQATLEARFADTPKRRQDTAAGAVITPGFGTPAGPGAKVGSNDDTNAANISVLPMGDQLWALWEAGSPLVMDPNTLATRDFKVLRPDLKSMPFLAHPRREPNGRVWNLGLAGTKAIVWRLSAIGDLEAADLIDLPRASYVHDFTASDRHLIIVLQPWVQDRMTLPYVDSLSWRPEMGTQVLVLDKADLTKRRLFDLPSFFCFHLGDAWAETDGTLRFDACVSADPGFALQGARDVLVGKATHGGGGGRLAMITLRPNGTADLAHTGLVAEFPRTDRRFAGARRRFTVHATTMEPGRPLFEGIAVHDWTRSTERSFAFGSRQMVEEAVFAARPGSSEEFDGWLLVPTLNLDARASELHVFDARRVEAGPICGWRGAAALPVGLHGAFVSTRA
jgi:all-trans-8'-apo-beta-carotenal 15,15'-oxygenase